MRSSSIFSSLRVLAAVPLHAGPTGTRRRRRHPGEPLSPWESRPRMNYSVWATGSRLMSCGRTERTMEYYAERHYGCRVTEYGWRGHRLVVLENEVLRVGVVATKGADIVELRYKP